MRHLGVDVGREAVRRGLDGLPEGAAAASR
jgi:hypothetical protein